MMLGGAAVLAIKGPSLFASFTGGSAKLLPAVLAGFLGFCAVMVDPSACSISLEGSTFYQLRAMARDGIDQTRARARLQSQPDNDFYRRRCDVLLENDCCLEEFQARVRAFCAKYLPADK